MAVDLTLAPALGRPMVAAQGQAGGYDAIDFRQWAQPLQEGVMGGSGAFRVTQNSAGASMSVDVACNVGQAVVKGDSVTSQGLYIARAHPTKANLDIAAAHATLPRIDSVIVHVEDTAHDASGQTRTRVRVLTGVATSGASLDNRSGAAAIPASAVLLADVLVAAADTIIANNEIRDRRPWSLGASWYGSLAADVVTSTVHPTYAEMHADLACRIECSGEPVRISFFSAYSGIGASSQVWCTPIIDGSSSGIVSSTVIATYNNNNYSWIFTPTPGSHRFSAGCARVGSANGTIYGSVGVATARPIEFIVEEILSGNQANNTVTSG